MKYLSSAKPGMLVLLAAISASTIAHAQNGHEHHKHGHTSPDVAATNAPAPSKIPSLKILMPESGAVVGSQLAVVFETPANLSNMTMSAPVVGVHLHIQCDDMALMPTAQQLIRLGKNRYLYLFDLPVPPGPKTLRVYWSDAQHKTIESSMQKTSVIVAADPPG